MLPSIFGENLFDDFFDSGFDRAFWGGRDALYGKHAKHLMKTDVKERPEEYELAVDLPGFQKDEVNVGLENGYLTIRAAKGLDKDKTDKDGKYIRQERYAGVCTRPMPPSSVMVSPLMNLKSGEDSCTQARPISVSTLP